MKTIAATLFAFVMVLGAFESRPVRAEEDVWYKHYAALLSDFVDAGGLVDYAGLARHPGHLEAFAAGLAELDAETYQRWSEPEKIAFWINAYNGLTLKLIVDRYPIGATKPHSADYPANSIRQIPGAWTEVKFEVMGEPVTLDAIENDILRARFDEPRIHMALVCAALSCPPLRGEPFTAAGLEEQLDDQARMFLANSRAFRADRDAGIVWLSAIFDWFGGDFVSRQGRDEAPAQPSDAAKAVVAFVSRYVSDEDRAYLASGDYRIEFLNYDWTLNEKRHN